MRVSRREQPFDDEQSAGRYPGVLDHQNCRDHAGRNRRRYRDHDAQLGLSRPDGPVSGLLVALVVAQMLARKFQPFLYWATIVASTTFGTTMADFADRSLGIGYTGGRRLLFICLIGDTRSLVLVAGHDIGQHRDDAEGRGVLLGRDHILADARHRAWRLDGRHRRLGYEGGALVFAAALAVVVGLYLDECLASPAILGGVHSHTATRRHGWRLPR